MDDLPSLIPIGYGLEYLKPFLLETYKFGLDLWKEKISQGKQKAIISGQQNIESFISELSKQVKELEQKARENEQLMAKIELALESPDLYVLQEEVWKIAFASGAKDQHALLANLLIEKVSAGDKGRPDLNRAVELIRYLSLSDLLTCAFVYSVFGPHKPIVFISAQTGNIALSLNRLFSSAYEHRDMLTGKSNLVSTGILYSRGSIFVEESTTIVQRLFSYLGEVEVVLSLNVAKRYLEEEEIGRWLASQVKSYVSYEFSSAGLALSKACYQLVLNGFFS